MKKWLKIATIIVGLLLVATFTLYQIYLSPGFVEEPELSAKLQTDSLSLGGESRSFDWYAPSGKEDIRTILYVLHGSRSSGQEVRISTAFEFDKIADEEGILIVYPTGYGNHWNDCRASADYSANTADIDDFAFFERMEEQLEQKLGSQFQHRFATGHSNGGHMCFKLALEHPDWIQGIAPISANLPIEENLDCKKRESFVPICLINGTADNINPYEGGLVEILGNASRGTVLSTDETMAYWTSLISCSNPQSEKLADTNVEDESHIIRTSWDCQGSVQAINYQVVNGGHTIPHPKSQFPKLLGVSNQDMNAPRAIWDFFKGIREAREKQQVESELAEVEE
ncbi:MAG: hypothetical protein AAGD28_04420 [Bacteroidota bacterium]